MSEGLSRNVGIILPPHLTRGAVYAVVAEWIDTIRNEMKPELVLNVTSWVETPSQRNFPYIIFVDPVGYKSIGEIIMYFGAQIEDIVVLLDKIQDPEIRIKAVDDTPIDNGVINYNGVSVVFTNEHPINCEAIFPLALKLSLEKHNNS